MSVFKWIELSSFLMLLLHLTAVTGEATFIAVRDGNDATLSCKNLIQNQERCDSTTWVFWGLGNTPGVELVRLGQIGEYARDKSDRLNVTENCSLVIKKVTLKDVGTYGCYQYKSEEQQGHPARVDLSIVTMTEHKNNNEVTLNCSVTSYEKHRHTVEWLHVDHDVDTNNNDVKTTQSDASASVTLTSLRLDHKSDHLELFMCKVMDIYTKQVQLFTFSSQTSGEKTTTTTPTTKPPTTTDDASTELRARTDYSVVNYIMLVLHVAELVLITVITVLLIRARGNQRPPDDNTVHHDEDDVTVCYENIGGPSASVFTHQQLPHQLRKNKKMRK